MGNDTNGLRIIDAKRTLSAGAALLLTGLASVGLASQFAAQAAVPSFYVGRANAAAIDVAVSPGQQALGQDRDAGALVAQAVVDSFGTSAGFASHPYPTDAVTGQLASNYPFFVSSSFPASPKQVVDQPGSRLSSVSSETTTDASASGSPNVPGADIGANSSVVKVIARPDGSIMATADARVRAVDVAGVLKLSDLHSHAMLTRTAAGRVTHSRGLEIGALTVAGQAVELTDHGLAAAGQTLPLPTDAADQALKQAGITLKLVNAGGGANTASAPAVLLSYAGDVPGVGQISTSLLLGYSSVSLGTKGQVQSAVTVPTPGPAAPVSGTPPLQPIGAQAHAAAPPPVDAPSIAPNAVAAQPNGRTSLGVVPQAFTTLPPYSWISLYVVTLAAALALGLGSQFVRLMGVRAR